MTDTEMICEWMEPMEDELPACRRLTKWWKREAVNGRWSPRALTHDALHEVEDKLIRMHKARWYDVELKEPFGEDCMFWIWHASKERKIKCLAAVIRHLERVQ